MYGEGISRTGDLLDLAVEAGIVDKSGAWYSYEGERLGQGRENAKQSIKDNNTVFDSIFRKVKESMGLIKPASQEKADKKNGDLDDR